MSEFESIKMSECVLNFETPRVQNRSKFESVINDEFEFWYGTSIRRQDWTFEKKIELLYLVLQLFFLSMNLGRI